VLRVALRLKALCCRQGNRGQCARHLIPITRQLRWLAGEPPNLEAARRSVERIISDGWRAGEVSRIRALVRISSEEGLVEHHYQGGHRIDPRRSSAKQREARRRQTGAGGFSRPKPWFDPDIIIW
jgi:hypothetical protein